MSDGAKIRCHGHRNGNVQYWKIQISTEIRIGINDFCLLWLGRVLEDEKTIEQYGIGDGCVINVVLRPLLVLVSRLILMYNAWI